MATDHRAGLSPGPFTATDGRRFAFPVGLAFLGLAGVLWWRDHLLARNVLAGVAGVLILAGAVAPAALGPVFRAWMGMAALISRVTTPIVMGVVYFLVLTPVGILRRTLGSNPIVHAPESGSYWVERDDGRSDLERQF